jgi:hypothetical protein
MFLRITSNISNGAVWVIEKNNTHVSAMPLPSESADLYHPGNCVDVGDSEIFFPWRRVTMVLNAHSSRYQVATKNCVLLSLGVISQINLTVPADDRVSAGCGARCS